MFTYNGIGTRIYGKRNLDEKDSSYTATKFFTILFFPIVPLGSFRVIKEKQKFLTGSFPRYQMTPTELNTKQIVNVYLAWWIIPLVLVIIATFYH